jgi:hypothetical protein
MASWIDGSLYPDENPPGKLDGISEQIDFLARLCSAWDFGILPEEDAILEIRSASWREAVDLCQMLTSPAYHLLRSWHGLPELSYLGPSFLHIVEDPNLEWV